MVLNLLFAVDVGDDLLRRLMEKTANRIDDRLDEVFKRIRFVETEIGTVKKEEADIKDRQVCSD